MTFRDRQFERDLQAWTNDDQAFSRLIRVNRDVKASPALTHDSEVYVYYATKMPSAIPAGATCACCGFKPLVNVRRLGGHMVGVECAGHQFGSCRNGRPAH